jgi:hypothetical protein
MRRLSPVPVLVAVLLVAAPAYRHRLHKAGRLVVRVRVVVKDQAGNATVVNRKVVLKG